MQTPPKHINCDYLGRDASIPEAVARESISDEMTLKINSER